MSVIKTISDYVQIVKRGIENKDQIIEAIRTSSEIKNKTGEVSDEAIAEIMMRKDICANCEFNSKNAKVIFNYDSNIPFQHCIKCLCRIGGEDSKEYCLSCQCGMTEHNKQFPNDQKPLRWEAFKTTE